MDDMLEQFNLSVQFIEDTVAEMLRPGVSLDDGIIKCRNFLQKAGQQHAELGAEVADGLVSLLEEVYFAFGSPGQTGEVNPGKGLDAVLWVAEKVRPARAPEFFPLVKDLLRDTPTDFSFHVMTDGPLASPRKILREGDEASLDAHTDSVVRLLKAAIECGTQGAGGRAQFDTFLAQFERELRSSELKMDAEILARHAHEDGPDTTLDMLELRFGLLIGVGYDTRRSTSRQTVKLFTVDKAIMHPDREEDRARKYHLKKRPLSKRHEEEHDLLIEGWHKNRLKAFMQMLERACRRAAENLERLRETLERRKYRGDGGKGFSTIDVKSIVGYEDLKHMTAHALTEVEHFR